MNSFMNGVNNFLSFFKNFSVDVKLEGWPAAITGMSFCGAAVGIYALKVTHPTKDTKEASQSGNENPD